MYCRQVACGARHSCALTHTGSLYTWGCNLHHQCGVASSQGVNVPVPTLVLALGGLQITCVAAGLHHTIVCTDAGRFHILLSLSADRVKSLLVHEAAAA